MARSPKKSKAAEPILDSKMSRPTGSDLYIWCDYIELRCLVDKDRRLSRGRVQELLDDTAQMYGEQTDADVVNPSDGIVDMSLDEDDSDAVDGVPPGAGHVGTRNEMRVAD